MIVNGAENFRDSKGRLSNYGLACGYIERLDLDTIRITLSAEHGNIEVAYYEFPQDCQLPTVREFYSFGNSRAAAYRKYYQLVRRAEKHNSESRA